MKIRALLSKALKERALKNPILLIPILLLYIVIWYLLSRVLAYLLILPIKVGIEIPGSLSELYFYILLPVLILVLLVLFLIEFFKMALEVYKKHIVVSANKALFINIVQLFLASTIIFALLYYYIDVFNYVPSGNFNTVTPISYDQTDDLPEFLYERLTTLPSFEAISNYLYLSLCIISNLGFGDIYPKTTVAKFVCSLEALTGILILTISIGSILNQPSPKTKKSQSKGSNQTIEQYLNEITAKISEQVSSIQELENQLSNKQIEIQKLKEERNKNQAMIKALEEELKGLKDKLGKP